jgi:transcriptional regulator with XRE-family HTH domain
MKLTPEQLAELRSTPIGITGNRLAKAIELVRLKQADVAAAASLSQPYVSDVARGRHETITVENAHKFSDLFGCAIEDLFPSRAA